MTTEQFIETVLPTQGFRFVTLIFPDGKISQRNFSQHELGDLIGFALWGSRKGANAYFAVGGYQPAPDGTMKRTAACATFHRCLRLDLDCGADKPYPSQGDAAAALTDFIATYKLPAPSVVDSGYGLHVYWAFDTDVDLTRWHALALRLKAAADAHGLLVDPTTTIDAARILRMPGSHNYKAEPKLVRVLCLNPGSPPALFEQLLPAGTGLALGSLPRAFAGETSELSAGMFPPYWITGMVTQCPGLRRMVTTQGANTSEKLWFMSLGLIHKAQDDDKAKDAIALHMSKGHAGFNPEEFERKWSQVQQQNYHPTSCARMEADGLPECQTCPFRGHIKTPSALGRAMPVAAPCEQPAIPPNTIAPVAHLQPVVVGNFLLDPHASAVKIVDGLLSRNLKIEGRVPKHRREVVNADGSKGEYWTPIIHNQIIEVERLLDAIGKQSITAITFDRFTDGEKKLEFTNADMVDPRAFATIMHKGGVLADRKSVTYLQDNFMPAFLQQLQRARAANHIAGKCGWSDDLQSFVLGTRLFTAAGEQHVRPSTSPREMEAYHVAGDEAKWRTGFDLALAGGPDRQVVLALSIAAPLMVFSGIDGLILNAYSPESGVGKSTLCDAAISVWGSPHLLRKSASDTANSTWKLASITGNLPMVVDEFTNVDGKSLSDYIYTVTEGREKHRLTSDAKLNASDARWCLPVIMTSNNSMHDKLQAFRADAVAEAARVFELRMRPLTLDMRETAHVKQSLLGLRSNYGFLGPQLVKLYLSQPPQYWRDIVASRIAHWDRTVSHDASDRFRAVAAALADIGAGIGQQLGFAFDRRAVMRTITEQWLEQRKEFESARQLPLDYIVNYLNEHNGEMAIFGGANGDSIQSSGTARGYAAEIRGREVNRVFQPLTIMIPQQRLKDYVRERNGNYKSISEWMKSEMNGGCVSRMGRLRYLDGMTQSIDLPAVEFNQSLLRGGAITLASVPAAAVPTKKTGVP